MLNRSGIQYIDTGNWNIKNTGVINTYSTVQPSAVYTVRASEIGINLLAVNSDLNPVKAKIGNWATTLRDFSSTKDFIQVQCATADTDKDSPAYLDLSSTNLILRPDAGYTAGTAYTISADTLVTYVDGDTESLIISGFDSMQYSAEMSDFITTDVTKVADGEYQVALVPANTGKTKKLISAAAMGAVDFTRANLDQISHELEKNDRLHQKWFITPYYSKFKRDEGTDGHANGGVYSADSKLKSFLGGVHYTIYPQEDKNWIRTQATYFHNSGDTSYTMNTDTSTLNGRSSNKSDGFYLAANYGFKNEISDQNFIDSRF